MDPHRTRRRMLEAFVGSWSQSSPDALARTVDTYWTPSSTYVDPLTDATRGRQSLVRLILDYAFMFPGGGPAMVGDPVMGRDSACYLWRWTSTAPIRMLGHDHGRTLLGMHLLQFGPDHRLARVTGRFAPPDLPALEPLRSSSPA